MTAIIDDAVKFCRKSKKQIDKLNDELRMAYNV